MVNYKSLLNELNKNLNILREREAKYAGNVPLDLLNQIDGVNFDEAWPHRKKVELEAEPSPIPINYLDLENLIKNKEASARPKDLDDLKYLKSSKKSD